MGIKIDTSADTPLSDGDRDLLAGLSVMMLAIANGQSLADRSSRPEHGSASCPKASSRRPRGAIVAEGSVSSPSW